MKLITNINGEYLKTIHESLKPERITEVKAAIAYASDDPPPLFEWCWRNKVKLSFWCRYDHKVPVSTSILKRFLDRKSFLYNCYLTTNYFHAKIIWFVGHGAYIGSANLTDRAWNTNIEAGLFLSETELLRDSIDLSDFFASIHKKSTELNEQTYEYLLSREKFINKGYQQDENEREEFIKGSPIKIFLPDSIVTKKQAMDRAKENFLERWNLVTGILEKVTALAGDENNFPSWIPKGTSSGIVSDQFLHDFYYRTVRNPDDRKTYRIEEFFDKNKNRQTAALKEAIDDWKSLPAANSGEGDFILHRAPVLNAFLERTKLPSLSEQEFIKLCLSFHSFWEVARYIEHEEIGLTEAASTEDKAPLLAKKLFYSRTKEGLSILQVLHYVIYGGSLDQTVHRFWEAKTIPKYRIAFFGDSCLGELVGWAMPDKFHPINGRTLKALRSLGHDVNFHL